MEKIEFCINCGKNMKLREGNYGLFVGCSGFPKCNYKFSLKKIIEYIEKEGVEFFEASKDCWKCHKNTNLTVYAIGNQIGKILKDDSFFNYFNLLVGPGPDGIEEIDNWMIKNISNINIMYSKTVGFSYPSNCCDQCGSIQGAFFLFQEPDSPFWNIERLKPSYIKKIK